MKQLEGGGWDGWLTGRKKGGENNRLCWDLILLQRKYKSRIAAFKGPVSPAPGETRQASPEASQPGFQTIVRS